ncbi:MAG: DUF680 domain-containing protein [Mesorhizobium sp.]|nr:MAG: DUF680 domain-containing protein [Mesorhizobium sp.]
MNRITLIAAAILLATVTAFAGSDHYGSENVNKLRSPFGIDHGVTASIHKPATGKHVIVDPNTTTVPSTNESWPDFNRGIWGNN